MVTKPKQLINQKIKLNNKISSPEAEKDKSWTKFTYIGYKSNKIEKILKKQNIKVAYTTNNNLANKLQNHQSYDEHNRNGIYKIQCEECKLNYVGQTKKPIKERYREHLKAYKNPNIYKSNLATHAINTGHEFPNLQNLKLIKQVDKGKKMDILENLYIYKYNKQKKLIQEQIQIKTKQDQLFNLLEI